MVRIFELATSGFWEFIAVFSMTLLYLNVVLMIIHKAIRAITISKQGYPPAHCDGDGDKYKEY